MLLVALDIGHKYKTSHPQDRGAFYNGLYEADLVETYIQEAQRLLSASSDIHVVIPDPWNPDNGLIGEYADRHKWVNDKGFHLYIQCHLNAGKGNYSLVGYATDISPPEELVIAKILEHQTESILGIPPGQYGDHIEALTPDTRGFCTVNNLQCVGLLYEPCFIDNPVHFQGLSNGSWISLIAQALASTLQQVVRDEILP